MTSIEPGSGWSERLNPRNWTLAWKLAVVGLVPALLALALGVLRIADDAEQAGELGRSSRLVEVRDQVASTADALRTERNNSALFAAGGRIDDRAALQDAYNQVDGQINEMANALRGTGELDPATAAALQRTENGLGRLAALRTDVADNPAAASDQVVSRYGQIIEPIDVLDRALLRQLRTPGTAGLTDAITAVTSATEQLSTEHTVLAAAIRSGQVLPGDQAVLDVAAARLLADYRDYQSAVTPEQLTRFGPFLDDTANAQREALKTAILGSPEGEIRTPAAEWDAAYDGSRAAADGTAQRIRAELVTASTTAGNRASNLAGINAVILLLGLLAGITIAVLVARSLVRSLRVLRTSALDVAERRLPQTVDSVRAGDTPDVSVAPVPLHGRDEVVQVARAFDAVHVQAIKLAADQAVLQAGISAMFVNLSRRSQALVERQLQLIEQLENNEQDADQLSNLFQLDHLATRMRRNSENLLVLAGTDVAKRNVAAVPMVDVLRAAVSEVEQYQRIVVQSPPTVSILGRAASDLVHLLAELLDNATIFSPPDSQVVMSSTRTADGAIVVEIADRGVGMTEAELANANTRLSGPSSVDVSTSRRMGLFVVGRLAARHGVEVRLSSSGNGSGSGLTASVTVPVKLVPTSEPRRSAAQGALVGGMKKPPALAAEGPTQRAARNGMGRPGPLSPMVVGPAAPVPAAADRPAPEKRPEQPSPNGFSKELPTRLPGSSLRAGTTEVPTRGGGDTDVDPVAAGSTSRERPDDVTSGPATGPTAAVPTTAAPTTGDQTPSDPDSGDTTPPSGVSGGATPGGRVAGHGVPETGIPETGIPGGGGPGGAGPGGDRAPDADRPAPGERFEPARGAAATPAPPLPQRTPAAPRTDPTPVVGPNPYPAALPHRRPAAHPDQSTGPRPFPRVGPTPGARPGPQRPTELFASSDPAPTAPLEDAPPPRPYFDPAETTPIFEEIASAWFRSNRAVPVEYGADAPEQPAAAAPAPAPPPTPTPERPPAPEPVEVPSRAAAPRPARPTPVEPVPTPAPAPAPEPVSAAATPDHGFASLADEGWRAARGATSTRGDELTSAGLPKRRPRARLVPGSAGSAVLAPPATPSRSAENVRGRLASYQQGVRLGRESRSRGDDEPTPATSNTGSHGGSAAPNDSGHANAHGNHDEESS
ncbi:MAG TPA: nitrate- and nitrite sensing domain-containing protein [Pseudonocardia sp.]|nr:nitrate- and nitrite sensing domain-containing protein [Pseudonocardia sp.]